MAKPMIPTLSYLQIYRRCIYAGFSVMIDETSFIPKLLETANSPLIWIEPERRQNENQGIEEQKDNDRTTTEHNDAIQERESGSAHDDIFN